MWGNWPGASQAGEFCWNSTWAADAPPVQQQPELKQQALQQAPPTLAARPGQASWCDGRATVAGAAPPMPPAAPPPLLQSRSGAAALSARRVQQQYGGSIADPFSFDDEAPRGGAATQQPRAEVAGWRGRSTDFLTGGAAATTAAAAARPHAQQPPRPPPPAARAPRQLSMQAPAAVAWPVARPAGPAAKPAPPAPAATAADHAAPTSGASAPPPALPPPPTVSLSLERYLEFWQLLTKGTGRMQPLSELERSILKATDLKQILLVNGLNASSRGKKEMQERMGPLELFAPLCLLPDTSLPPSSAGSRYASAPPPPLPDAEAVHALGWLAQGPAAGAGCLQAGSAAAGGSCCALPAVRIRLQDGGVVHPLPARAAAAAAAAVGSAAAGLHSGSGGGQEQVMVQQPSGHLLGAHTQQLADSQVTLASAGGCLQGVIQVSPEVAGLNQYHKQQQQQQKQQELQLESQQGGYGTASGGSSGAAGQEVEEEAEEEEEAGEAAPEWLVQGVAAVAERSQGSGDGVDGKAMLGRRVAFVLLEDFDQDDAQGITDTVVAGVLEGQVVERVGLDHDEDCPPGCAHRHRFHYVRVPASKSTAPPTRRQGRRLDLVVDLQDVLRQHELEGLLGLADEELQEAWVLLEPRPEPEDEEAGREEQLQRPKKAAATAAAAGAAGMTGSGGWHSKRGAPATAAEAAAKRRR